MENIVYTLISKLLSFGFFDILAFILVLALLYAILRKSKILGENPVIDGVVSFGIAFMVLAFPVLTGIGLTIPLSKFFTQASVFFLIFLVGFLLASMFYPNLTEWLPKVFTSRNTLFAMIALGIALFITSGLVGVIYQAATSPTAGGTTGPSDIYILVAGLVIFIVIIMLSATMGKGG